MGWNYRLLLLCVFCAQLGAACSFAAKPGEAYFSDWPPGATPAEVGKRVATNVLARKFDFETNPKRRYVIYPEVVATYGALTVANLIDDRDLSAHLQQKFEPFLKPEGAPKVSPEGHVDYRVFGIVPLEIYMETGDQKFLDWGKGFADSQWEKTTEDGITAEARYWIDDMYMITVLETQAYRATGDPKYIERAARTMVAYVNRLQQTNGLFFHGTNAPFFWSRGNGWVAAGMAELLRSLPETNPQRGSLMAAYQKIMSAVLKYQDGDGLWHQLVDDPSAWTETSGSGMFAFALVTGVKVGWLKESMYGPAARKAWLGLVRHIDSNGNIDGVCAGTNKGDSKEFYLQRPRLTGDLHGEAAVLWTASALLR